MTTSYSPENSDAWRAETSADEHAVLNDYLGAVFATPFLQEVAARTLSLLRLQPRQAVLEVGCGTGVFLPLLAREVTAGGSVVGVDHSPAMVRDAQAAADGAGLANVAVRAADACDLPFEAA